LPPSAARTLLHEVDDQIEEAGLGRTSIRGVRDREPPRLERLAQRLIGWLPEPAGEDPTQLAYAEASARRLAARRTGEALELFERLPSIDAEMVEDVKETFALGEREASASLEELDRKVGHGGRRLRRRQAESLSRIAVTDALRKLTDVGLLPEVMVSHTAQAVAKDIEEKTGEE